jgi:hypothetical protein
MKGNYFRANITLIRDVWRMNREEFGQLFNVTGNHIAGQERGTSTHVPLALIFDLEDMTGIPAKRLYREHIPQIQIPLQPLAKSTNVVQNPPIASQNTFIAAEGTPQYMAKNDIPSIGKTENMTQLERIERLEQKVFGV